ncbi:hypothetical protein MJ257_17105 [Paenibacillus timonensis]|uniref:Stalk domain-containing protein n=1 Tax=Paenibacillus timonensis TaxID=225915 RepID=A0ABW3SGU6_9BACL|nr:hypothetical protein [Paenibacillus timonensis]MCH1641816.1 hypothetical protein [Paenibacillus timonensis]
MKKILLSVAASILLLGTLTAVASAATNSLIGKKVQNVIEFTVNGKPVKDAVVIDGTTYVPARSFSEAAGYSIAIEGGKVNMTGTETVTRTEEEVVAEIKIKNQLNILQNNVSFWKASLVGPEETAAQARKSIEEANSWNAAVDDDLIKMSTSSAEEKLKKAQAEIAELQAKIDAAEAEIAELQKQLNK